MFFIPYKPENLRKLITKYKKKIRASGILQASPKGDRRMRRIRVGIKGAKS
jgi:hypothetical protein